MPEEIQEPSPEEARGAIAAEAGEMTAEQLAEAKRYGRQELICALADKALDVAYLAVAAFLLAQPVATWLGGMGWLAADSLRLVVLFFLVVLCHAVVSFPLSYYSGHVLEHRYGLSRQTFPAWLWRYAKRNALAIGFGAAMFLGLYWVIWLVGPWWWLVAAAAFFLVSVVLGQLAPVLILPLFYKIERLDNAELAARMTRLAEGTGMSIEGVYRMAMSEETAKANAMLAGLGRTRRVLLGDTLLEGFSAEEIEVVFAHEIGHHVLRHLPKQLAVGLVFSAAGFWVCDRLVAAWANHLAGTVDYARLPIDSLPMLMLILTVFAMLLEPLQNVITRRYERQADRYALARTGLKDAYLSAFRKLARLNKDDPNPHPVEVFLFHSHPPIGERLAMAEKFPQ